MKRKTMENQYTCTVYSVTDTTLHVYIQHPSPYIYIKPTHLLQIASGPNSL